MAFKLGIMRHIYIAGLIELLGRQNSCKYFRWNFVVHSALIIVADFLLIGPIQMNALGVILMVIYFLLAGTVISFLYVP